VAQISVNGTSHNVPDGLSVYELLNHLGIVPRLVVVEINQKVVYPEAWKDKRVSDNDKIEIVSFVGGG
jgi:sulfur carrier protein